MPTLINSGILLFSQQGEILSVASAGGLTLPDMRISSDSTRHFNSDSSYSGSILSDLEMTGSFGVNGSADVSLPTVDVTGAFGARLPLEKMPTAAIAGTIEYDIHLSLRKAIPAVSMGAGSFSWLFASAKLPQIEISSTLSDRLMGMPNGKLSHVEASGNMFLGMIGSDIEAHWLTLSKKISSVAADGKLSTEQIGSLLALLPVVSPAANMFSSADLSMNLFKTLPAVFVEAGLSGTTFDMTAVLAPIIFQTGGNAAGFLDDPPDEDAEEMRFCR